MVLVRVRGLGDVYQRQLYALLVSGLVYRDLTLAKLRHAAIEAGISTGVVLLIIMASRIVGWVVTYEQLPAAFTKFATETLQSPWLIILAMNRFLTRWGARNAQVMTDSSIQTLSAVSEALETYRETTVLHRRDLYVSRYERLVGRYAVATANQSYIMEIPKYVLDNVKEARRPLCNEGVDGLLCNEGVDGLLMACVWATVQ